MQLRELSESTAFVIMGEFSGTSKPLAVYRDRDSATKVVLDHNNGVKKFSDHPRLISIHLVEVPLK